MVSSQATKANPRCRGTVYILVLGASLLVAAIGVSSLMAARVQRQVTTMTDDKIQARELARSAIDRGLYEIRTNPGWRATISTNLIKNINLAGGQYTLQIVDPVDGNPVNNTTDPAWLIGEGKVGAACYQLAVLVSGDGTVQSDTWTRVVQ